jgi:hypothetical protein
MEAVHDGRDEAGGERGEDHPLESHLGIAQERQLVHGKASSSWATPGAFHGLLSI